MRQSFNAKLQDIIPLSLFGLTMNLPGIPIYDFTPLHFLTSPTPAKPMRDNATSSKRMGKKAVLKS